MKRKPKAYKRSARKQQILKTLRIWHENGIATQATSYKLAKALELEPSPHFRSILNEMVEDGDLVRVSDDPPGRWETFFYLLSEKRLITEKYGKRRIVVKRKGAVVGQMELAL